MKSKILIEVNENGMVSTNIQGDFNDVVSVLLQTAINVVKDNEKDETVRSLIYGKMLNSCMEMMKEEKSK